LSCPETEENTTLTCSQGKGDNFYKSGQLLPENFETAVKDTGIRGVNVRYHDVSFRADCGEG
jgi:hypothetical protein